MPSTSININDIFFGSEQSKYAGIALFATIIIICLAILFSSSKIPIDQRLMFVLFVIIISVPSILMSLFELTCIVTGGNYNTRWWCWALAWVLSAIIIIYCIMIIISMIMSMSSYDMANERISENIENSKVDKDNANKYAVNIMKQYENDVNNNRSSQQHHQPQQHIQQEPQHIQQKPQHIQQEPQQESQHMQQESQHMQQEPQRIQQESQHMQQEPQHMQQSPPIHNMETQPFPQMSNNDLIGFDHNDNLSPLNETRELPRQIVNKPDVVKQQMSYQQSFDINGFDNLDDKYQAF
jgi:flagellar biosynthesis GTPase FlhF